MRISAVCSGGELNINTDLTAAMSAAAEVVENATREACPVDTGALRASISGSATGSSASVSAGMPYAAYVEFGTSKAPAQPFLVPALLNNEDAIASAIAAALENITKQ